MPRDSGWETFEPRTEDRYDPGIYLRDVADNQTKQGNIPIIHKKVSRPGTENELSSGLGLILCKEFIEKHKGKIWAVSEVNNGSTFYFTLPLSA